MVDYRKSEVATAILKDQHVCDKSSSNYSPMQTTQQHIQKVKKVLGLQLLKRTSPAGFAITNPGLLRVIRPKPVGTSRSTFEDVPAPNNTASVNRQLISVTSTTPMTDTEHTHLKTPTTHL